MTPSEATAAFKQAQAELATADKRVVAARVTRARAIEDMRKAGMSWAAITAATGMDRHHLWRILAKAGIRAGGIEIR